MYHLLKKWIPKGLLWRLSFVNLLVITGTIGISGWAIYKTACFLAGGIGNFESLRQQQFNTIFLQYVLIFGVIGLIVGGIIHYHLIKKLLQPINQLIDSTKQLQKGEFPAPIDTQSEDEVGKLVKQFNGLITQLENNKHEREQFISDISHEFRTPLSNLSGYLYALKTGHLQGDEEMFASLYSEMTRLTHLLDQMNQLKEWTHVSNQAFLQKESTDIKEQINQSVTMFSLTLEKWQIPLVVEADEKELMLNIQGIQQILNNLIDNAIRYYKGDSPIYIYGKKGENIYTVSVTGPSTPISQADAENIFNRFYRIESSRSTSAGGSGLGLAIVKEMVEKHGGSIGLTSKENKNTFWFTLPFSA